MTRIEATELLSEYSYLKGSSSLRCDVIRKVECVAVAPFDELDKLHFFNNYQETRDASSALAGYDEDEFDLVVMLIDLAADGHVEYTYQSLADYLEEKGTYIRKTANDSRSVLQEALLNENSSASYWGSLAS